MLAEFVQGKSMTEIAKVYGVTRNSIRYHAIQAGLIPAHPTSKEARLDEIARLRKENHDLRMLLAEKALQARLVGR